MVFPAPEPPTKAIKLEEQAAEVVRGCEGDGEHIATCYYQRTRIEGRDARKMLDSCLRNRIIVTPFVDPDITAFDYNPKGEDPQYLATLILSRYDPRLLDFEIENRVFRRETVEKVRALNRRFPPRLPVYPKLGGHAQTVVSDTCSPEEVTECLRRIVTGPDFAGLLDPVIGPSLREAVMAETPLELQEKRPFRTGALLAIYEFLRAQRGCT